MSSYNRIRMHCFPLDSFHPNCNAGRRRFQQAIVEMCDKSAPQADGTPSLACPACLEEFGTSVSMVAFDCGHAACLSCVTHNLRMLRDSSNHAAQPLAQPLACFLGRDRCKGVLFCAETRAVLGRIQLHARSAGDSEPPPPEEEAAEAPRTPHTPDAAAAAADADTPPPTVRPEPVALDADAVG